jgi:hypothetical protein
VEAAQLTKEKSLQPESATTEVSFCPMLAVGDKGELVGTTTKLSEDVGGGYTRFEDGDVIVLLPLGVAAGGGGTGGV